MGRKVSYFGDGFQKRIERFGRKMWWIPTLGGEFILDRRLGYADGLMGGNIWYMGEDEDAALAAAEAGVAAVRDCPGVIMPFPGGIAGSGSKAGSKYSLRGREHIREVLPDAGRATPRQSRSCRRTSAR